MALAATIQYIGFRNSLAVDTVCGGGGEGGDREEGRQCVSDGGSRQDADRDLFRRERVAFRD